MCFQLDKHRGNYLLKEAKLASALIRACGLDAKVSRDAQCVQNWKKYGTVHAGNFAAVTEEVSHELGQSQETIQDFKLKKGLSMQTVFVQKALWKDGWNSWCLGAVCW